LKGESRKRISSGNRVVRTEKKYTNTKEVLL